MKLGQNVIHNMIVVGTPLLVDVCGDVHELRVHEPHLLGVHGHVHVHLGRVQNKLGHRQLNFGDLLGLGHGGHGNRLLGIHDLVVLGENYLHEKLNGCIFNNCLFESPEI